jgi:hypothetical protein
MFAVYREMKTVGPRAFFPGQYFFACAYCAGTSVQRNGPDVYIRVR